MGGLGPPAGGRTALPLHTSGGLEAGGIGAGRAEERGRGDQRSGRMRSKLQRKVQNRRNSQKEI